MASSSPSRQEIVDYNAFINRIEQHQRERSTAAPKLYDVFISHRGPDVKKTFASQLYISLQNSGCRAFLDHEEIEGGDSIPCTIHNAICSSVVQIGIFSKGYAESSWCLDELVLMLQQNKALFIPVFYDVDPSTLRYIDNGVYAEAFSKHLRKGRYVEKLDEWKKALISASYFSGYELSEHQHNLCDRIVSAAVKCTEARKPVDAAKYPVGLSELLEDFETHCRYKVVENVKNIVGIFGLGGSGKTTLAREFFNRRRSDYDASCFLHDVREASNKGELHCLQTKLLKDLLSENRKFDNTYEGAAYLRYRLEADIHLRFLIVLDDIDHPDQLDAFLFKDIEFLDSLVIVTTRDQRLLTRAGITIQFKLKGINCHFATELFCWHAFRRPDPIIGYENLVKRFVEFCGGLPLSLKVLAALVSGNTDRSYWQLVLDKVSKALPEDITQRLKISVDSLDSEEKQIFADIACFFIGKDKDRAIRIWKGCGWSAEHALQTLSDKCLVEEDKNGGPFWKDQSFVFRMHDHLRDLGRQMADKLSPPRLWHPQHLQSMESKGFRSILTETNRRCFHWFWDSTIRCKVTYFIGNSFDCIDTSTVLLWLELEPECKLKRIPSWIPLQNLQGLYFNGAFQRLWQDDLQVSCSSCIPLPSLHIKGRKIRIRQSRVQAPLQLKELVLHGYTLSDELPMLSHLGNLETLILVEGSYDSHICKILPRIRNSALTEGRYFSQHLTKISNLRILVLNNVRISGELALSNPKDSIHFESWRNNCMNNLQTIRITFVAGLSKLSISGEICPRLQSLQLTDMFNLIEVDLKQSTTLKFLQLSCCMKLKTISGLSDLTELATLKLSGCSKIQELPSLENLRCLQSIQIKDCEMFVTLKLCGCWEIGELQPSLAHLSCLESLHISGCHQLHAITGVEELEGSKDLHLVNGGGGLWNCIYALKRLPSEVTTVIRKPIDRAESLLNANLFSGVIDADSGFEIHSFDEYGKLKMAGSLSAIIICVLLECHYHGHIRTPRVIDNMEPGEWIVTTVVTDEKEISRHDSPHSILQLGFNAEIKRGYIMNVKEGEESRILPVFKKIIDELYRECNSGNMLTF